ncbi:paired amphipathic helix protein Sin3-like 1 isoform X2 [Solanum dulcamara]|uniref:paired amphipathic helix protein Sin3-like 1 isoform X2 n=1 Tax=Solanum dulcamara TaxID=45834 RepID=UPI00248597DC|nr:paired amphipathic helix protein Sin3-like 1 isoform X2 [Solanum dulcamara]
MKRLRDDVYYTPPFKRSFCSFHGESIDILAAIAQVKDLFEGHPSLILGFNAFLPNRYEKIFNDEDTAPLKKTTYKEQALKSMEKLIDNAYDTPPFKRPFCSSHGESYVGRIDVVVALSYLRDVRDMFSDQREKCEKFRDVMKDLKAKRIDTVGVIARVKELFKEHPSLLLGFNAFVPNGYKIILNDEDKDPPKKPAGQEQALNLVNKIKKHLGNNHEFKSFLNIMRECRKESKDVKEVYHEVAVLLNDRPDLLDEFSRFLPDSVTTNPLSNLDDDKMLMK